MTEIPSLESSLARFSNAMLELEVSTGRRLKGERNVSALQQELQQMVDDRARIADSLDTATERSERLEKANREVSKRLVSAMESIRKVLEGRGD